MGDSTLSSGDSGGIKHDARFGTKIDLILSRLVAVDSKLELINSSVKSFEEKLSNIQVRVEKIKGNQSRTKVIRKKCKISSRN